MATTITYGGSGNLYRHNAKVLLNMSSTQYQVQYSYDTVANGYAYPIIAVPHGYVAQISGGSRHGFAAWLISDSFDDIAEQMTKRPEAFDGVAVILPGKSEPVNLHSEQCHVLFSIEDNDSITSAVEKAVAWHNKFF